MSKYLSYILNLRGAAILIVAGVHARGNVSEWSDSEGMFYLLSTIFDSREGNGTVMFIFIGGFLFQYITHQSFDFRKYLEKKLLYVLLPYVLVSIPIIAFRIYTNYSYVLPPGFNDSSVIYRFFYYLVTGVHLAPFWFISAIVLFYISAPLFHALDNPKCYLYVLPVLFVASLFTYRSAHNANPLLSYIHYFPVYYLGMCASYYRNEIFGSVNRIFYPLLIIYAGITLGNLMNWIPLHDFITFQEVLQNRLMIFNLDLLKAVMLCFVLMLLLYKFREKRMLFLEVLGEYSFGIFFVHCIFIYSTRNLWEHLFGAVHFSMLTFLIYFSFILLISTVTVYFIKRMTGRYSRILIGS